MALSAGRTLTRRAEAARLPRTSRGLMRGIRRRGGVGSIVILVGLAVASVSGGSTAAGVEAKVSKKDKAILAAAVIQDADAPSGWTSSQPSNTGGNDIPGDAACSS